MKRSLVVILFTLAVLAVSACSSGWGPGYCYGEGGQPVTCVSPGNPGAVG